MKKVLILLLGLLCISCSRSFKIRGNEVIVPVQAEVAKVRFQILGDKIVRVSMAPRGSFRDRESLVVVDRPDCHDFRVISNDGNVTIETASMKILVKDNIVSFIQEGGTTSFNLDDLVFRPVEAEGKKAWGTTISFDGPDNEGIYGLGQHQSGELDHKGRGEELYQYNTKISVPFIVSTAGYGILFDAYSLSRWGNPEPYGQLGDQFRLYDKDGLEGALTGTYAAADGTTLVRREDSLYFENEFVLKNLPEINLMGAKVVYEGWLESAAEADYCFNQYYAGFQRTVLGSEEVMSRRWRAAWNPNYYKFVSHFTAGERKPLRIEWEPDGDVSYMGLRVAPPQSEVARMRNTFSSEFEPGIDFYFIVGENADEVIHGYRSLTGKAPVMPRWALGFWQSRERYTTQDELVETLAEFRSRHIPIDNIVQDWQYWEPDQWGSHEFEASRYPDPEKMLDDVHAMNARFMISVWPKFYTNTVHFKELRDAGHMFINPVNDSLKDWLGHYQSFYDAYSKEGREMFWRQIDESLYSRFGRKIDAWWMDASEPNLRDCLPMDYMKRLLTPTELGPSAEYFNAYALVNADGIYNGQRSVDSDKRVFLLTRNGFAGLQRYSTASWSGDIGTSWTDLKMQFAAGLDYCLSGIPFWTMDVGGFSVMNKFYDPSGNDEWMEFQTRSHQAGAFLPLFRTHGQWPYRELWNIAPEGSQAYSSILYYMKLRYRLMPYIYSLTGAVHFDDYTIMRALPMEYPDDLAVRDLSDEWMFGPALLVCPVTDYKSRSREIYFPEGEWYDFYSGFLLHGSRTLSVAAPYERMPLYVRAGSIIPFGPEIEWTDEKPASEIRLYVYTGDDASFKLYEDGGLDYGYEKGEYATVPVSWNEESGLLTIGERSGSFPGMLEERVFHIVKVDGSSPRAFDPEAEGLRVEYSGECISVAL